MSQKEAIHLDKQVAPIEYVKKSDIKKIFGVSDYHIKRMEERGLVSYKFGPKTTLYRMQDIYNLIEF